ncbi:MAG TPA: VWA domain-containing protein [Spirochaetota bacterium]|nr:VWA domain-containing protein [Spirochaetota bacterium]
MVLTFNLLNLVVYKYDILFMLNKIVKNKIKFYKKIFLILFITSISLINAYAKDISIKFNMTGFIKQEYFTYLNDTIKYWIETNTKLKLSQSSLTSLEINIKRVTNSFVLEATLKESNSIVSQYYSKFYTLTDFFNALDDVLYKTFYNSTLDKNITSIQTADVIFLIDSTSSMNDEIEFLKRNIEKLLFRIIYNLKNYRIRFGISDYRESREYKIKFNNLTQRLEPIIKHILSTKPAGYNSDLYYAMDYVLKYGDWKDNRFLIVITDSINIEKDKLKEIKKRVECANIQLIFLLADSIKPIHKKLLLSVFPNSVFDLTYILTFLDDKMSLRNFIYKNKYIYEIKENEITDITLGREVETISTVQNFLNENFLDIKEMKELRINFEQEIDKIFTRSESKKIIFEDDDGKILFVPLKDKKQVEYYKKRLIKNKKYIIGGTFLQYEDKITILPYTFKILEKKPVEPIYQNFTKIAKDPVFFYDKGIFEPSFWATTLIFKGIE